MLTCSITDDIVIDNPAAIDQMNSFQFLKGYLMMERRVNRNDTK